MPSGHPHDRAGRGSHGRAGQRDDARPVVRVSAVGHALVWDDANALLETFRDAPSEYTLIEFDD